MKGHECYHCKQWVAEGEAHDCWTTSERALTKDLSEDLQDAFARLREAAVELGEQRIYASHNSIMFARKACYFFVRPRRSFLEVGDLSWPRGQVAADQEGRRDLEVQARALHPGEASRRSRGAADRLAQGSLRFRAGRQSRQGVTTPATREEDARKAVKKKAKAKRK